MANNESIKMNTLLAKVDHEGSSFNKMVADYGRFFKSNQGMFKGLKKTHEPYEGYNVDPAYVANQSVATTVKEKLDWFQEREVPYLKSLFSVEATNSAGANTVPLIVDGVSFGNLTALELMRLKSFLTNKELDNVYANIPVREDSKVWNETTNAEYAGREVYETALQTGHTKTTEIEEVILKDPNIDPEHLPANYRSTVVQKKKTVDTGDYTLQYFTGEWTQRAKAELLRRKSNLLGAVIEALKKVNEIEASATNLDVDALVNYIHYGK